MSGGSVLVSAVAVAFAAVLATGATATSAAQATTSTTRPSSTTTATRLLDALPVGPERSRGYDRDRFYLWSSVRGCDTRERVMARQNLVSNGAACGPSRGRWFSAYDGATTRNPSTFDIDHVVPLAEAWESGAFRWTAARRERFANDLAYRPALLAVSASSNRSKGERDPAEWMPPRRSYWCAYLRSWVGVKYRWGLSVDVREKAFVRSHLAGCDQTMTVPRRAR
jgi:hypothetical protein